MNSIIKITTLRLQSDQLWPDRSLVGKLMNAGKITGRFLEIGRDMFNQIHTEHSGDLTPAIMVRIKNSNITPKTNRVKSCCGGKPK